MFCCIRCKKLLDIECDNKTCDECMYYIGYQLVCERCNRSYSRTNCERHYRSYKCRVSIFIVVKRIPLKEMIVVFMI